LSPDHFAPVTHFIRSVVRAAASSRYLMMAALASAPVVASGQAAPSASHRPAIRFEASALASTSWLKEGSLDVAASPGGAVGADAMWNASNRARVGVAVRASVSRVAINDASEHWTAGSSHQIDLLGRLELPLTPRFGATASAGVALPSGPKDVAPFDAVSGRIAATAEIGAVARAAVTSPLALLITAQGIRLDPFTASAVGRQPGTVKRLLVGVRYGR
jgi:hypothetical protein